MSRVPQRVCVSREEAHNQTPWRESSRGLPVRVPGPYMCRPRCRSNASTLSTRTSGRVGSCYLPCSVQGGPTRHPVLETRTRARRGKPLPQGPAAGVGIHTWDLPGRPADRQTDSGGRDSIPPAQPLPALGGRSPPARDSSVKAEAAATAGPHPSPDVGETVSPKILSP